MPPENITDRSGTIRAHFQLLSHGIHDPASGEMPPYGRAPAATPDYLNLIFNTSDAPHASHSNVRRSWSGSSDGSIRASDVKPPHFGQRGRYGFSMLIWLGSRGRMPHTPLKPPRRERDRSLSHRRLGNLPVVVPSCAVPAPGSLTHVKAEPVYFVSETGRQPGRPLYFVVPRFVVQDFATSALFDRVPANGLQRLVTVRSKIGPCL
jgi:hypothetical protein